MKGELKTKLDAAPLVKRLIEKSMAGKLDWEPTADRQQFITSVREDLSFKIRMQTVTDLNEYGQPEEVDVPVLDMVDEKGRLLWQVPSREVQAGELRHLYELARRLGNQLDSRVASAIDALNEL